MEVTLFCWFGRKHCKIESNRNINLSSVPKLCVPEITEVEIEKQLKPFSVLPCWVLYSLTNSTSKPQTLLKSYIYVFCKFASPKLSINDILNTKKRLREHTEKPLCKFAWKDIYTPVSPCVLAICNFLYLFTCLVISYVRNS